MAAVRTSRPVVLPCLVTGVMAFWPAPFPLVAVPGTGWRPDWVQGPPAPVGGVVGQGEKDDDPPCDADRAAACFASA